MREWGLLMRSRFVLKRAGAVLLSVATVLSGVSAPSVNVMAAVSTKDVAGNLARVSVHDPSVIEDPNNEGNFYVFGSHIATASSNDLANWSQVSKDYQDTNANHVYGDLDETFAESFKWAGKNDGDCVGGYAVWAPDVIWNPQYEWEDGSKGAYMLYYCTSSTWRRSCIGYLVSKQIDTGYKYVDTLVYSGFTNTGSVNYDGNSKIDTTWTNDYLNLKELVDNGTIEDMSTDKCFNSDGSWNNKYAPNAIDPTVFFDKDGEKLYMTYGSWSGGIFILELDPTTGEAIYPGKDGKDEESGNFVDRYFGTHIAGGNHQSGEGPFILYDESTDYYYMYETYGGLTSTGGYNMRLFRSKNVMGPYVDAAGNDASGSGYDNYKYGIKLIGNYQFLGQTAYRAAGHNSAMIDEEGNHYLVFHQRFSDRGESHEVRVRQQFMNEDGWPVTAVYENRNEEITNYDKKDVIGSYEFINHGNAAADGNMLKTESITLNEDGTISGDEEGTWTVNQGDGSDYITVEYNGDTYKGVFFRQTNDNGEKVMTFTAIGDNNEAIWGSQYTESEENSIERAKSTLSKEIPAWTREDLELPSKVSGVSVSWTSSDEDIISSEGKVNSEAEDKTVTLTASLKVGETESTCDFKVTVYKTPTVIAGYDFNSEAEENEIKPVDEALMSENAKLMGDATIINDDEKGGVLKVTNAAGSKQGNYLLLPSDIFNDVTGAGYTVSFWTKVGASCMEHSALFEGDAVSKGAKTGNYPMTRIGANLIGRINANGYSDAEPSEHGTRDEWEQVTYTVAKNGIKVYLNGKQIVFNEKDIAACFDKSNDYAVQHINHVMVGAGDIWGDEDVRDALFDDVKIYDSAMTAAEVKSNYENKSTEELDVKKTYTLKSAWGVTHVVDQDGNRVSGLIEIDGNYVYANEKGVVQKNKTIEIDGKYYGFNKDGYMRRNEILRSWGRYYYFYKDGHRAASEELTLDGVKYSFNENGVGKKVK